MNNLLITTYLFSIVIANTSVGFFGASALPYTAFFLIPFDLTCRDILHERWGNNWKGKMFLLIGSGSLLSYALNTKNANIAIASFCAFALAGTVDAIVFNSCKHLKRVYRINISNWFSSFVDSFTFQIVAYGVFSKSITASQTLSKFIGGIIWSLLFIRISKWKYRR